MMRTQSRSAAGAAFEAARCDSTVYCTERSRSAPSVAQEGGATMARNRPLVPTNAHESPRSASPVSAAVVQLIDRPTMTSPPMSPIGITQSGPSGTSTRSVSPSSLINARGVATIASGERCVIESPRRRPRPYDSAKATIRRNRHKMRQRSAPRTLSPEQPMRAPQMGGLADYLI